MKRVPWTEWSDIQGFYHTTPSAEELGLIEGRTERFQASNHVDEDPERLLALVEKHVPP